MHISREDLPVTPDPPSIRLVVPLHAAPQAGADVVGVKAATLGALAGAGLAVPEGLVLTVRAAESVRSAAGLGPDATGEQIAAAPLPEEVETAITAIAAHFTDMPVVVRSSAVAEDLAEASFAGQYDSVLGVRGEPALRAAIRHCWASAHGPRVRAYRPEAAGAPVAVLVQRQVDADVAGVAFSANPMSGAAEEVLVSALPGLADDLVAGRRSPDEWVVTGGVATVIRAVNQALAEPQARAVAALARRAEAVFGRPQDIEWAMAGGRLMILQARPITALPAPAPVELPAGTWLKDVEHYSEPFTALGASLAAPVVAEGLSSMFESFGGTLERMDVRIVGGEAYLRPVPLGSHDGPPPPWWVLGLLARVSPRLRRRVRTARRMVRPDIFEGLFVRWQRSWRPRLQTDADRLRSVDLTALTDRDLDAHLAEAIALARRGLHLHFHLIPLYTVTLYRLVGLCHDLLGWSEEQSLALVAGNSAASSAPSLALSDLADLIAQSPAARAAVLDGVGSGLADGSGRSALADRLAEADATLGAALTEWCDRYAYRNVHNDPGSPLWIERPGLIASLLAGLVHAHVRGEPTAESRVRALREAAIEKAHDALRGRPGSTRARFDTALAAATRYYPLREDTAFWAASIPGGLIRRAAVEAGRRLAAAGHLARPDDVIHLDLESIRAGLAADTTGGPSDDLRTQAARAKSERAWVAAHPGPAIHGPRPGPMPNLRGLPRPARVLNQALIWAQPRPIDPVGGGSSDALAGVAAAPGRYRGRVCVVRGEADFTRLLPGDVLVCPTTEPAWSVLFSQAGALVTDNGGVLSHAAIVAREHGIPAVVGTGCATRRLRDGDLVTVLGSEGRVCG